MNKLNLKIAWRILVRQKLFSLVNIMGLAIGMAACLLIIQYISFELSYDNFHKNGTNIYRVKHQNYRDGVLIENLAKTYSAVGPALKAEFPEVQEQARVSTLGGMVTARQSNGELINFNETAVYQVDESFLKMFSFPMLSGTNGALSEPNTAVITEQVANKYFPGQNAIGKTINVQEQTSGTNINATITGIFKNVPTNSHLQFDFLLSADTKTGDWVYPDFYTYIQLSPHTTQKSFEAKLSAFVKNKVSELSKNSNSSNTQGKTNLSHISFTL